MTNGKNCEMEFNIEKTFVEEWKSFLQGKMERWEDGQNVFLHVSEITKLYNAFCSYPNDSSVEIYLNNSKVNNRSVFDNEKSIFIEKEPLLMGMFAIVEISINDKKVYYRLGKSLQYNFSKKALLDDNDNILVYEHAADKDSVMGYSCDENWVIDAHNQMCYEEQAFQTIMENFDIVKATDEDVKHRFGLYQMVLHVLDMAYCIYGSSDVRVKSLYCLMKNSLVQEAKKYALSSVNDACDGNRIKSEYMGLVKEVTAQGFYSRVNAKSISDESIYDVLSSFNCRNL